MRLRILLTALLLLTASCGTDVYTKSSAPPSPLPAPAPRIATTDTLGPSVQAAAAQAAFTQLVNLYVWNTTVARNQAAADAAAAARRPSRPRATSAGGSGDCANPVVPAYVAMRESGCNWNAYNASGCGGRGCIGFYQLDAGHFAASSPWNPSAHGTCYGLDPNTQAGQTECASRLGRSAWNE